MKTSQEYTLQDCLCYNDKNYCDLNCDGDHCSGYKHHYHQVVVLAMFCFRECVFVSIYFTRINFSTKQQQKRQKVSSWQHKITALIMWGAGMNRILWHHRKYVISLELYPPVIQVLTSKGLQWCKYCQKHIIWTWCYEFWGYNSLWSANHTKLIEKLGFFS